MTPESLIEHGYKRFGKEACAGKLADELYQKKVADRYFINIYRYTYKDLYDGWQPEAHFSMSCWHKASFNVTLIGQMTIEEIESFFAKLYERMECKPYDEEYCE